MNPTLMTTTRRKPKRCLRHPTGSESSLMRKLTQMSGQTKPTGNKVTAMVSLKMDKKSTMTPMATSSLVTILNPTRKICLSSTQEGFMILNFAHEKESCLSINLFTALCKSNLSYSRATTMMRKTAVASKMSSLNPMVRKLTLGCGRLHPRSSRV